MKHRDGAARGHCPRLQRDVEGTGRYPPQLEELLCYVLAERGRYQHPRPACLVPLCYVAAERDHCQHHLVEGVLWCYAEVERGRYRQRQPEYLHPRPAWLEPSPRRQCDVVGTGPYPQLLEALLYVAAGRDHCRRRLVEAVLWCCVAAGRGRCQRRLPQDLLFCSVAAGRDHCQQHLPERLRLRLA